MLFSNCVFCLATKVISIGYSLLSTCYDFLTFKFENFNFYSFVEIIQFFSLQIAFDSPFIRIELDVLSKKYFDLNSFFLILIIT